MHHRKFPIGVLAYFKKNGVENIYGMINKNYRDKSPNVRLCLLNTEDGQVVTLKGENVDENIISHLCLWTVIHVAGYLLRPRLILDFSDST